ncbi:hypothetical protein [Shewanella sedimentimangrovi]|uniref:Uncharacterized protein n=1 Tax=Shewanella sedimentimangrovi TaxID=2814293 RepID=A0ABX7R3Y0_9GAMM|nr:hypothetical protein [Shewanella sedimentimangrovi]QSX37813.1 hypothetical protein JYB85_02935 [Shewanella sedimentimangrovi]
MPQSLDKIKCLGNTSIKSTYQRVDLVEKEQIGVVGTLVAHLEKIEHCVKFECWELFNAESNIFYAHGEFNLDEDIFTHLDGSTIFYTREEIHKLMSQHIISRGVKSHKLFRLDGRILRSEASELLNKFLPLEDLSCEYLEHPT